MTKPEPSQRFSLKDHLFNRESVTHIASRFRSVDEDFPEAEFIDAVMERLAGLELKARISYIAEVLGEFLPSQFDVAASLIRSALPPPLDPGLTDDDFGDFIIAPLGQFVAVNGLAPEDYGTSMELLHEITKRFSMEGPIRPFIDTYPERTMGILAVWASDPNYHVR